MSITVSNATGSESRLVKVLDNYLAASQRGDPPDKSALLAAHPDLAEDLEACLASLDFIHHAAAPGPSDVPVGEPSGGRIGDFRIIQEAGRGGMGVVYEAEQVSLGRRVALKVLPFAAALDPRQLARFRVEVQAAAQLHHTNIVPVFSVGSERGVHYYAMQFIDGHSLGEVINGLRQARDPAATLAADPTPLGASAPDRLYFQAVARLGMQAAEALEHAHSMGIVHRDVKPANLLLDTRGNLWVTDFGLARLHDDAGLTMTGDVLGTLRYMSPEQAMARRVLIDQRTDVYSLGVTLYELLTLRPAFDGRDRQELLRQIAFEEPPSPRRTDPAIPRALETVVLKAMAKEPEGRYATMRELADDLRRFLEHRPILARPPTLMDRAAKWSRRHSAAVGIVALALLVGTAGLALGLVLLGAKQSEVVRQRDEARRARADSERWSRQARRAVDEMYTRVAERWLAGRPRLEQVQREFLEEALRFYDEFGSDQSDAVALRRERAAANHRAAEIRKALGDDRGAEAAYRRALAGYSALAAEFPAEEGLLGELAREHYQIAGLLWAAGRTSEAEESYRAALDTYEALVAAFPARPEFREGLADALESQGMLFSETGRAAKGDASLNAALRLYEGLAADRPGSREGQANALNQLAGNAYRAGKPVEAGPLVRRAIDLTAALVAEFPSRVDYRDRLNFLRFNLAAALRDTGRPEEAEEMARSAVDGYRRLKDEFPGVPDYRLTLATALGTRAGVLRALHRDVDAEVPRREGVAVLASLAEEFPDRPEYHHRLASDLGNLGGLLEANGKVDEAEASYRKALVILNSLVGKRPEVTQYRSNLAVCQLRLAKFLLAARRTDELGELLRVATEDPVQIDYRYQLAECETNFADLLVKAHRYREAEEACRRAAGRCGRLLTDAPDVPGYEMLSAFAALNLGETLAGRRRFPEAIAADRRGVAILERLRDRAPDSVRPEILAEARSNLAAHLAKSPGPREPDDDPMPNGDNAFAPRAR